MLFALPEYDVAARDAVFAAVDALTRAGSPLLAQIPSEAVSEMHRTRISVDGGASLNYGPVELRGAFEFDIASICAGNLDDVLCALDAAAREQVKTLVRGMVERLDVVTSATGNHVDAGGRPLSHELVFELLETMTIDFDAQGQAQLTFVAAPDLARKLAALPPMNSEQQSRFDAIMARKRQEFDERARSRRLRPSGRPT